MKILTLNFYWWSVLVLNFSIWNDYSGWKTFVFCFGFGLDNCCIRSVFWLNFVLSLVLFSICFIQNSVLLDCCWFYGVCLVYNCSTIQKIFFISLICVSLKRFFKIAMFVAFGCASNCHRLISYFHINVRHNCTCWRQNIQISS